MYGRNHFIFYGKLFFLRKSLAKMGHTKFHPTLHIIYAHL